MKNKINSLGGVHYDSGKSNNNNRTRSYRGSVNILGTRYRTKRYTTKRAAREALNVLIKDIFDILLLT